MKELSIKEKAERYDEVVNKLKVFMARGVNPLITRDDVQDFFPELKESEDEKVRKTLIRFFEDWRKTRSHCWGVSIKKILAWLEKQGEQKPVVIPKFRVGDFVKDANYHGEPTYEIVGMDGECYICQYRGNKSMGDRSVMHFCFDNPYLRLVEQNLRMIQWKGDNLKEVIDFTGKDKNFDKWFKSFEDYKKFVREHEGILKLFNEDGSHYEVPVGAWIVKTPDGRNVASKAVLKQKPAWSEEEKKKLDRIYYILGIAADEHAYSNTCRLIGDKEAVELQDFLRSIAKPEQKPVWSEEDDEMVQVAINACNSYQDSLVRSDSRFDKAVKAEEWLKDLKDRVQPQEKQWKPSDEQMKVLDVAIKNSHLTTTEYDGLVKLREQLKKL